MRDFGRVMAGALQWNLCEGHQPKCNIFTHTLVFNDSLSNITHLALDHISGTKHKTPTWYAFYCLLEFIGGCLHVPVALSKQCDLLPVSPSSLTPTSPSKCCVLCSDPLTAQSTFSRMEIDHSIPSSHPPSWQFSYPLIPVLKEPPQ